MCDLVYQQHTWLHEIGWRHSGLVDINSVISSNECCYLRLFPGPLSRGILSGPAYESFASILHPASIALLSSFAEEAITELMRKSRFSNAPNLPSLATDSLRKQQNSEPGRTVIVS